jgi:hypothetical protein
MVGRKKAVAILMWVFAVVFLPPIAYWVITSLVSSFSQFFLHHKIAFPLFVIEFTYISWGTGSVTVVLGLLGKLPGTRAKSY